MASAVLPVVVVVDSVVVLLPSDPQSLLPVRLSLQFVFPESYRRFLCDMGRLNMKDYFSSFGIGCWI